MDKDIILIFGGDGKIARAVVNKYLEDEKSIVLAVDRKEASRNPDFYKNNNYHYYSCDVTDIGQLSDLYNKISEEFGFVSHIISMAGAPFPSEENGVLGMTFEDINKSISLNLSSHIYITKIFLPLLQKTNKKNKSIIFFSSVNALRTFGFPAYSAGKSGIYGFMNSIVRVLGAQHIRVNTLTPGTVASQEEIDSKEQFWGYCFKDMMALKSFTLSEDIANVCFSLTHITTAITGQNIIVDSGQIS